MQKYKIIRQNKIISTNFIRIDNYLILFQLITMILPSVSAE